MIGIILQRAPESHETFIAVELDELERQAVEFRVFAVETDAENPDDPPAGDGEWRDRLQRPHRSFVRCLATARAHLSLALRLPRRYWSWVRRELLRQAATRMAWLASVAEPVSRGHGRHLQAAIRIADRCRALGIDHVHAHYATEPAAVAFLVHELLGITFSFTAHSKGVYGRGLAPLARRIEAASFVVGCSESVVEQLVDLAPQAVDRVHCIPHGLSSALDSAGGQSAISDGAQFAAGGVGSARATGARAAPLIVAAGRLADRKGFDLLLRALGRLQAGGLDFQAEIVGAGSAEAALKELAAELQLNGDLTFRGHLPHREFVERLRHAHCFVAPSRVLPGGNRDAIPGALAEAMAVGTPVVAAAVGGLPEVVVDGETGVLFRDGDVAGLVAAIEHIIGDRSYGQRLAARASERSRRHFDGRQNAARLAALLLDPAAARSGRRSTRRPLRVGYVLKRYPRLSETFILQEILEQERQGTRVHIISLKKPDEGRFHSDLARVRADVTYVAGAIFSALRQTLRANLARFLVAPDRYLRTMRLALRGGDRHPFRAFLRASLVAEEVENRGLEHLHAHFATGATFMAMLVSGLTGVPYSFTGHARDIFGSHVERDALRRKVAAASFVVLVSDYTREVLRSMCDGIDDLDARLCRIYNGVRPDVLAMTPPPFRMRGRPLVLGVGRLVPKKGFEHLIGAAARLLASGHDFRLAIVGAGPERRRLTALASKLGVPVMFLGAQQHDRTLKVMAAARVVVLPAVVANDGDRDVLPTVLVEAQALARPAVGTRVTGIPEIIDNGSTGYVVEPAAPEQLAAVLAVLLTDASRALAMGEAGRVLATERFAIRSTVADLRRAMARAAKRAPESVSGATLEQPPAAATSPELTSATVGAWGGRAGGLAVQAPAGTGQLAARAVASGG